ncbi:EI24 domain-containing protein [Agromyces laixinhei]|uniref:EI24 domain-containing protein n=1 Tax=Agromyces laixinhei TaxID=2585717 RepID=UPI001116B879|nr:EI24 domain-containing protein [Agromyces laixinhei]
MLRRFLSGAGLLFRGFGFWGRRPGVMLLGLIPAAIVFVIVLAALVALGIQLPAIAQWATPFAESWDAFWAVSLRIGIAAVTFAGAVLLAAVTFTALTLAVGDPFYERIWRAVELELGGEVPDRGAGFWRAAGDAAALIALGIVAAVVVGLVGFVPLIGTIAAPVLGVALSGWLLARELTARAFEARGITAAARKAVLRGHRARMLGFGVATQLCFMVPLGAVVAMPAAVAGSTMLARGALDAAAARMSRNTAPGHPLDAQSLSLPVSPRSEPVDGGASGTPRPPQ